MKDKAQTKSEVLDELDFANPFSRAMSFAIEAVLANSKIILAMLFIVEKKRLVLRKDNLKVTIETYE